MKKWLKVVSKFSFILRCFEKIINLSLKKLYFSIRDIKYHIWKVLLNLISSEYIQNYEIFHLYTEGIALNQN